MKNRLLTLAGALMLLAVFGHFCAKPLLAQIRAALVQNRDEPARQPFSLNGSQPTPSNIPSITWQVPAGKRYVVEQYEMRCNVDTGGQGALSDVDVRVYGGAQAHTSTHSIDFIGSQTQTQWVGSATTRLYADQGAFFSLEGTTNYFASGALSRGCAGSVSGYAIDLP